MLTHPPAPVAAGDESEPEPQHERDTSNPDAMPELPRMPRFPSSQATSCPANLETLLRSWIDWNDTHKATTPARRTLSEMAPVHAIARDTERRQLRRAGVA
ncbi:hypothetical protein ACTWQF_34135 [Streptomyces sp. 8N114]|uniref:hypothetical protein n=1 Tax=Streptomyces sp. 8N114 TaxID=3457419 RepID=UPI003FCFE31F